MAGAPVTTSVQGVMAEPSLMPNDQVQLVLSVLQTRERLVMVQVVSSTIMETGVVRISEVSLGAAETEATRAETRTLTERILRRMVSWNKDLILNVVKGHKIVVKSECYFVVSSRLASRSCKRVKREDLILI